METLLLSGDDFSPFSDRSARGPQKVGPARQARGPARPLRISTWESNFHFNFKLHFFQAYNKNTRCAAQQVT